MVGRALGALTEREGRALVVEVLWVRESGSVLTLHIISLYISLAESLRISSTLIGAGSASGECEHEQDAEKPLQLCSRLEQVLNVAQRGCLRPCWEAFLSILREWSAVVPHVETIEIIPRQHTFLAGCW